MVQEGTFTLDSDAVGAMESAILKLDSFIQEALSDEEVWALAYEVVEAAMFTPLEMGLDFGNDSVMKEIFSSEFISLIKADTVMNLLDMHADLPLTWEQ